MPYVTNAIPEQYFTYIAIFGAVSRNIFYMDNNSLHLCTQLCAVMRPTRVVWFHYIHRINAIAVLLRFALGYISWGELYRNYVGNFGSEYGEVFTSCA
jgi:hypothetical protein